MGKRKPSAKSSAALVRQPHGGALLPGAGGGPQPRSGRPPDEFKAMCRELVSNAEVERAARRVLKDPNHPAWVGALKWATEHGYAKDTLTIVSPAVQMALRQTVELIASQDTWSSRELLDRMEELWK